MRVYFLLFPLTEVVRLSGIGKQPVFGRLLKDVSIAIGSINISWDVCVVKMSDSVILGLDFLDTRRAVVNVSGGTVVLNGEELPASLVDSNDDTKISRAILERSITIPPNSVMFVSVHIDPVPSSAYVLESRDSPMPVLMSNVIGSGDHCVVNLINDGSKFVKFRGLPKSWMILSVQGRKSCLRLMLGR
jgi:hypothetical protein